MSWLAKRWKNESVSAAVNLVWPDVRSVSKPKEKEYKFKKAKEAEIESVLKNIPALIIINEDGIKEDIIELCNKIRKNEDNSITPIIVISSVKEKEHRIQVLKACVEHYIKAPIDEQYLYYTVKNVIRLLDTNRRVSP